MFPPVAVFLKTIYLSKFIQNFQSVIVKTWTLNIFSIIKVKTMINEVKIKLTALTILKNAAVDHFITSTPSLKLEDEHLSFFLPNKKE